MRGSLNPLHVAGKLLQKHAESGFGFAGSNEKHLPESSPSSLLKKWVVDNKRLLAKAGLSSSMMLPLMAQAAAEQLQSGNLQAYVSLDELIAEGAKVSSTAAGNIIELSDGTIINLDEVTLLTIRGEEYVLLTGEQVPEGIFEAVTAQGNPAVLIQPASLEGVVEVVVEADGSTTLVMQDGSSATLLGDSVLVSDGNVFLLPNALDVSTGGVLDSSLAGSAATGYPLSMIVLGGLGAIGLAVGLSSGGGSSNGSTPPPEADTAAPAAPDVALTNDAGTSDTDGLTSNATLTITAEAGSTVEVFNGTASLGNAVEDGSNPGTFTFEPTGLAGDTFTLTATATDAAGNTSDLSQALPVTLDTAAPTTPVITLATDTGASDTDGITSNGEVLVSGLEANATWEYSVNGGQNWQVGEGSAFTLAEGKYADGVVQVRQTDVAGNVAPVANLGPVTIDVTIATPVVVLATDTGTSDTDGITSNGEVLVSGLEVDATWEYSVNGGQNWQVGEGSAFTMAEGEYADGVVQVRQTDVAGNIAPVANLGPVTVDVTIATPVVVLATDTGANASDSVTFEGTLSVSGLETGASWEYSVNGGSNWAAGTDTSFTLAEGEYANDDIQVRQADTAGNVSVDASPGAVIVDQTPPTVAINVTALSGLEIGQTALVTFTFSEAPFEFTSADITAPGSLALSNLSVVAGTNGKEYQATVSITQNTGVTDGKISIGTGIKDLAGNVLEQATSSEPFSVVPANPLIVAGSDAQFDSVDGALAVSAGSETLRLQELSFNLTTLTTGQQEAFNNLADVEMNSGSRLTISAGLAAGTTITAADTASVVITGLDGQNYDFSAITVASGKVAATVSQNVTLNTESDLGSLLIGVNQGTTLTLTAAQADGRTLSGEGNVQITALAATPDADLSAITATGTVEADFSAATGTDVSFTGQLGGADVNVSSGNLILAASANTDAASFTITGGAGLTGSAAQLDGLTVTGSGNVLVTELAGNTDLSGFADSDSLAVTAGVNQSLDLRANPDLGAVDSYQIEAGFTLTLTATQADGLTVTGDGNLIITNLIAAPSADLSGITANTDVQVTSSVEFTGSAGDASTMAFSVAEGRTLTLDSSAVDGRTMAGNGTLAVTGNIAANPDGSAALDVTNLTVTGVDLTGATLELGVTDLTLASSSVFTLLPAQAAQLALTGSGDANSLTIDVSGLFTGGATTADLLVNVSTLGGDDTLRFNFGPGDEARELTLTGSIKLGAGTNVLEVSNGVVSIADTEYSGVSIVQINSTLVLSADQFSDQLVALSGNPDSALRGAGSIEVTGTLTAGKPAIDLNFLGNFVPGGATPPTVAFPAEFVKDTDFILPTDTGSLLKVTVGGEIVELFNGEYSPTSVTVFTEDQLTGALGLESVETITLANSITLTQSLDVSIALANAGNVSFDFTNGALNLGQGVELTLTTAQADGARVSGEGILNITGASGTFDANLSSVSADTVNIAVADSATLDITGATNLANASLIVPAGATLVVNASQASGLNLSGEGAVTILLDSLSANLTGVGAKTALSLTAVVNGDTPVVTFTGRFGDSTVDIFAGQTLITAAANMDGRTVSGEGNITLINLGSVSDRQLDLSAVQNNGTQLLAVTNSVPVLGGDLGSFSISISANATFTSTAALLDGVTVTGAGNVRIGGLNTATEGADFSGLTVTGDVEIDVAQSITRTEPLPDGALVTVAAGVTLTVTPDVLADLVVFGNGNLALLVTQNNASIDLSLVLVEGATTVSFAEDVTADLTGATLVNASIELADGSSVTLSATQLDGRTVTGNGSVEIVGRDAAPDADLGGIADTVTSVQNIPTITVSSITADNVVNTAEAAAGVTVTGAVTGASQTPLAGLQVTVTLGETNFTATTDALGQWSVTLPQNRLTDQGSGDTSLTASVTNASGNSGSVEQAFTINLTPQPDVDTVTNINLSASYNSLAEAVDAAREGDTLTLSSGTYSENVTINKTLTIKGANAGEAPVDIDGNPIPDLADGTRTNNESWINGKLTIAADNVVIDGVRLHNADGPLDWDETLLDQTPGGLDGFQLLNSYLTGYTGAGAPRFNGAGDYVGAPVASNWVIENNLIGGMIDGAGGALYLSGLADSSVSDNVFWRPAAGHLYLSSLQNTNVDNNQFFHGVHAGGADFDGLADALLVSNGFGYGDAHTDGPDGYGGTLFGRNFWIEVKGDNSDVSISGNTGQYNSGGIQLYGEASEAYSFTNFTIDKNVFADFINADPTGELDGSGRSVSGFNGAVNVSVLNDSQATNLVITNNTITGAPDQIYSERDFVSLINIQGNVIGLVVTGNNIAWADSSQAVIDGLDALGLSLASISAQLQGIALTGGVEGTSTVSGNTISTNGVSQGDDTFVGIVIRNDLGEQIEGIGFYTSITTVDDSNNFTDFTNLGQSNVQLALVGFTNNQIGDLFTTGTLNPFLVPNNNAELADGGSDTIALASTAVGGEAIELLNFSFGNLDDGGDVIDLTGLPGDFATGLEIRDSFTANDTIAEGTGLLIFSTQLNEAMVANVGDALTQGQTLFVLADASGLQNPELADAGVGLFRVEDQGQTTDFIANFSDLSAGSLVGISGSNFLGFEEQVPA